MDSFADELLIFAYSRQVDCDPDNAPYYFECLQDLAKGRKSEVLETQVAVLASQGLFSRSDVEAAYRYIGVEPSHAVALSDEIIVSSFSSRLSDTAPALQTELREKLRLIGQARNSELIRQAAADGKKTRASPSWRLANAASQISRPTNRR